MEKIDHKNWFNSPPTMIIAGKHVMEVYRYLITEMKYNRYWFLWDLTKLIYRPADFECFETEEEACFFAWHLDPDFKPGYFHNGLWTRVRYVPVYTEALVDYIDYRLKKSCYYVSTLHLDIYKEHRNLRLLTL